MYYNRCKEDNLQIGDKYMKVMSKEDIKTRVTLKCFDEIEIMLNKGWQKTDVLLYNDYFADRIIEMYGYWYELTPSKETISEILKHIYQYVCEY